MHATQPTTHRMLAHGIQANRPRRPRRSPARDDTHGPGLVIVAHVASLLSVAALIVGLTFASIAMARRCIGVDAASGPLARVRDDGRAFPSATKEAGDGPTR
jgi:hypothetical protein